MGDDRGAQCAQEPGHLESVGGTGAGFAGGHGVEPDALRVSGVVDQAAGFGSPRREPLSGDACGGLRGGCDPEFLGLGCGVVGPAARRERCGLGLSVAGTWDGVRAGRSVFHVGTEPVGRVRAGQTGPSFFSGMARRATMPLLVGCWPWRPPALALRRSWAPRWALH